MMGVILDPDLERELERQANEHGYRNANEYLRVLLGRKDRGAAHQRSRGQRLVDQLRGKATRDLSTDDIMNLTRGDDT